MKLKITTVSPVHISSGEEMFSTCFHIQNGKAKCYDFNELLIQNRFNMKDINNMLYSLNKASANDKKRAMENYFRGRLKYTYVTPKYEMACLLNRVNRDVNLQIKSMNKPIIPGSSMKGLILGAIKYHLLKENKHLIKKFISNDTNYEERTFEKDLFNYLFPKNKGYSFDDMMVLYSTALICRDVTFDKMVLCDTPRIMKGELNSMGFAEHIEEKQSVVGEFITFNQNRIDYFHQEIDCYGRFDYFKKDLFDLDYVLAIVDDFCKDMAEDDIDYFETVKIRNNRYYNVNYLQNDVISILEEVLDKDGYYARIGRNTNYYYKSFAYLFKKEFTSFYERKFKMFSPVDRLKRTKNGNLIPNPKTMPNSRTVLRVEECEEDVYSLSGFIKIEKC